MDCKTKAILLALSVAAMLPGLMVLSGVDGASAQEIPGSGDPMQGQAAANEEYPELSRADAQHVAELTGHEDPSLANEYEELRAEITGWLREGAPVPDGLADDMEIAGVGSVGSAALLVTVDESNADLVQQYAETFANAYPHLNFEMATVGGVVWRAGDPVPVYIGH